HLHGGGHAGGDVVGVHEQGGVDAEGRNLRAERRRLVRAVRARVQQRERVCGRAGGRHPVASGGLDVRGGREPRQVGGARRRHRGLLVGAARPHLDDLPAAGGGGHPGGGGGDRTVVVEDGQHQGLEHHAFREPAADGQDGGAGEEQ